MQVLIDSNITVYDFSPELYRWCEENLVLRNPIYQQLKIRGKEDTIRFKHVPEFIKLHSLVRGALVIPFGCLRAIWPFIKNAQVQTKFNDNGQMTIVNDEPQIGTFYPYQREAIDAMVKAKGGALISAAGSGKTIMGIEIAKEIGKPTLWLCHTGDLLRQAADDILALYPNAQVGITTAGKLEIGKDFTVATIQTMVDLDPKDYTTKFDTVICDECAHVVSAPTQMRMFGKVLSNIPARYKFGLTATPKRADTMIKSMYAYLGTNKNGLFDPTYKVDRKEVKTIEAKHEKIELVSGYSEEFLYDEIYDTAGMIVYNNLINLLSSDEARTNKILDKVVEMDKEGRKQILLCSRVKQCEDIVAKLHRRGIKASLCVGKLSGKTRESVLKQKTEWDVLVATYSLLKEGVSIVDLDTLHLVTPIKDKATIVQCAGRIERYKEDKKQPIIFDYVDTDIPYCNKIYEKRRTSLKRRF